MRDWVTVINSHSQNSTNVLYVDLSFPLVIHTAPTVQPFWPITFERHTAPHTQQASAIPNRAPRSPSFNKKSGVDELFSVHGEAELDEDQASALLDEGGVLGPGITAAIPGLSGKALESMAEAIADQSEAKPVTKKRKVLSVKREDSYR